MDFESKALLNVEQGIFDIQVDDEIQSVKDIQTLKFKHEVILTRASSYPNHSSSI